MEKNMPNKDVAPNSEISNQQNPISEGRDHIPPFVPETKRVATLAIFPKGYPDKRLSKEEFNDLYRILMAKVIHSEGSNVPIFFSFTWKSGCDLALVVCGNPMTADWIKTNVSKISPWSGPELTTLVIDEPPKYKIVNLYLPNGDDFSDEEIKKLLMKQNVGQLEVDSWQLMNRKDFPRHTVARYWITEGMAYALSKYGNHLYFGLGRAYFKITDLKQGDELTVGEVAGTSAKNA